MVLTFIKKNSKIDKNVILDSGVYKVLLGECKPL